MIEVNLVPGIGKKKAAPHQPVRLGTLAIGVTGRLRDKFMIFAIVALAVSGTGIGVLCAMQEIRDSSLADRRDAAVRDSTRYANVLNERNRAAATRDSLLRQVHLILNLDEDRYVWPHIMDEVSRALPQYTWLTSVAFTGTPQGSNNLVATSKTAADTSAAAKKANRPPKPLDPTLPKDAITIRVAGRTADIQAVTRFMLDLESSLYLGDVALEKSELALEQGKEVSQFQLTIGYTRPDTLLVHRVPLRLSAK